MILLCVCVCVCIRVVRKDNKLTKTHPVPNPTTNLHYQDRGIHTLIDIQMWASDSHQNKPKRFALVPKSLSLAKIWITWTQGCCLSSGLVSGLWNLPTFVCSCLSSVGGGNHRDTHSQISELHHYLNSAALTPQSSFSLPSVLESTPTILATPKKLWELPLKKTYHLLFPMKKIRGKKLVNSLLCIKTCEGFCKGAPTPFRSPGNHGNEDQERTLSCWRPEPGFGGGNEQKRRGGGGVWAPKCTPQLYKP